MTENTRKRGPRPLRDTAPELERKKRISVYVNEAELQVIEGFSSISKTSSPVYLRQAGLKTPPIVIPAINQEAWSKLAGAAANLNQMVKQFNITRERPQSLFKVLHKAYADGNKTLQALATAMETDGVVVLSKEEIAILAEFRRYLIEARS